MVPAFEHQLEQRGVSIGRDLAARSANLVLTNDLFGLYQLVIDTVENNEDVRYAFVLDPAGNLVVHSFGLGFPTDLIQANSAEPAQRHNLLVFMTEDGPIHDVAVPIAGGRAGVARVGMTERQLQGSVAALTRRALAVTALVSLFGLVFSFYYLNRVVVRPLGELVQSSSAIARGDLEIGTAEVAHDEIRRTCTSIQPDDRASQPLTPRGSGQGAMRLQLLERVLTAQEEERRRIARELHDETGQYLTSLMMALKVPEDTRDPDVTRRTTAALGEMTEQALVAVRNELRPGLLDDLGLLAAIRKYASDYEQRTGIPTELRSAGLDEQTRLPADIELALYRIVQESLTNVARHAGARQVSVVGAELHNPDPGSPYAKRTPFSLLHAT